MPNGLAKCFHRKNSGGRSPAGPPPERRAEQLQHARLVLGPIGAQVEIERLHLVEFLSACLGCRLAIDDGSRPRPIGDERSVQAGHPVDAAVEREAFLEDPPAPSAERLGLAPVGQQIVDRSASGLIERARRYERSVAVVPLLEHLIGPRGGPKRRSAARAPSPRSAIRRVPRTRTGTRRCRRRPARRARRRGDRAP